MKKIVNPALFIGLGGTGHKVLLQVKKAILTNYGEVPSGIDMLCFDTDTKELLSSSENLTYRKKNGELVTESIRFENAEVYGIAVKNPDKLLKFEHINQWLSDIVKPKITPSDEGARQIRQMGRFAIFENSPEKIREKIREKISRLNDISNDKDNIEYDRIGEVCIHLVFSPCGGTGAGTFIDIVMNLKKINPRLKVYGYLVMPEFYTGFTMTHSVVKNTYASLLEIDHLMGKDVPKKNDGKSPINWSNYGKKPYEVNYTGGDSFNLGASKFFENLYLFDKYIEGGGKEILDVRNVYDRIGRILYMMVSGPGQEMQSAYNNNDDSDYPSSPETNGKRRNYSSMGISQIILDKNYLKQLKTIQIVNEILKTYCFDSSNLDSEILNVFIDSNSWREDNGKNMIIDRLMTQSQLKYNFESVYPSEFKNEANIIIETNVKNLLRDIDLKIKTNCNNISSEIFTDFKVKLSEKISLYLKNKGGVNECKQFLSFMIGSFQGMSNEMNDETIKHASNKSSLEKNLLDFIVAMKNEESSFNPIGKKARIQKECENYVGQSEKILLENWQFLRKESAKLFFDKCLEELKQKQKQINSFAELLIEANTQVETKKIHLLNRTPAETDFETYIHTHYKEILNFEKSDIKIEEAFREIDFSKLLDLNKISEIISIIQNFATSTESIKAIDELTAEKILIKLPEDRIKNIISYLDKSSSVCIDIDSSSFLNNSGRTSMQKFGFICVEDEKDTIFNNKGDIYKNLSAAGGYSTLTSYSTNDPNRITIIKVAGMFPGIAIKRMADYKAEFISSMKFGGYHYSDTYFEKYAQDLIDGPSDVEGEGAKWFTVASAIGKIFLERAALTFKKDSASKEILLYEGSKNKTDRSEAVKIFIKNKENSAFIEKYFYSIWDNDRPKTIETLVSFFKKIETTEVLGKQFDNIEKDSPEYDNIFMEKSILKDFCISLGISPEKFD